MNRRDVIAGVSLAGLLLPEAVAYSGIAGLAPGRAIMAAIVGCCAYALVGRSRFAIVSPTSSSAAIMAGALAALPGLGVGRDAAATVIIGFAGIFFLVAALLRLGGLTGFIARPVLRGFAFGLAITIIARQLPAIAGVHIATGEIFALLWQLLAAVARWNPVSVATGIGALAALLALRRLPMLPGAFLVIVAGIALSKGLDLPAMGVATVGAIDVHVALPSLPDVPPAALARLAQLAMPLALILLAEHWGTTRALALRHGESLDAGREVGALGLANVASALAQGMPVAAGFSAGSAAEAAGAASRFTALVAAGGLALLILVALPHVAALPEPVLAAVVVAALLHALDPTPLLRLWRLDRDQYVALGAAAGVLLLGVVNGMLAAIALSLLALIQRLATPIVLTLGRLGDSHDFVDLARHDDASAIPGIAIFRPTEALFFANAERMLAIIETRAGQTQDAVIVSLEQSYDFDSTALDALFEFQAKLTASHTDLWLARVHDRVRDILSTAGEQALLAQSRYSVDDAVTAILAKRAAPEVREEKP